MTHENIRGVDVVHWNPRRNQWPYPFNRLQVGRRVNNFGDLLGPLITRRLVERHALQPLAARGARLLAVGSIMGMAQEHDVIWGTGVNGKVAVDSHRFAALDVRAVRGPRTAAFLRQRGIEVPDVFGDPALLVPELFPELSTVSKKRKLGVVPNFHDLRAQKQHPGLISPLAPPMEVIREILASERIVASSLHGVVIAEAFGIPAVTIKSGTEHPFKYEDYFEGTGRSSTPLASDVTEATKWVQDASWPTPYETWSPKPLLASFPTDLWSAGTRRSK